MGEGWGRINRGPYPLKVRFIVGQKQYTLLRVYAPDLIADPYLSSGRLVTKAYEAQKARSGFETRRDYSGIIGVAPVFAKRLGKEKINQIDVLKNLSHRNFYFFTSLHLVVYA